MADKKVIAVTGGMSGHSIRTAMCAAAGLGYGFNVIDHIPDYRVTGKPETPSKHDLLRMKKAEEKRQRKQAKRLQARSV